MLIPNVSVINFLLTFRYLLYWCILVYCTSVVLYPLRSFQNTSQRTAKATGYETLLYVVLYLVRDHPNTKKTTLALKYTSALESVTCLRLMCPYFFPCNNNDNNNNTSKSNNNRNTKAETIIVIIIMKSSPKESSYKSKDS